MYAYGIFRNAIQLAFANVRAPITRLSPPWPYPYDAAFNVRHDFEDFQNMINALESSSRFEFTNGAFGDYFFCTGTLRDEMTKLTDRGCWPASRGHELRRDDRSPQRRFCQSEQYEPDGSRLRLLALGTG